MRKVEKKEKKEIKKQQNKASSTKVKYQLSNIKARE